MLDLASSHWTFCQVGPPGRCRVFVGRVWPACGLVVLLGTVALPLELPFGVVLLCFWGWWWCFWAWSVGCFLCLVVVFVAWIALG